MAERVRRGFWAATVAALAIGLVVWIFGLEAYAAQVLFRIFALPLGLVAASALLVLWLRRRSSSFAHGRRAALALASAVLVLASIALGRSFAFARPRDDAEHGRPVTLVTYNVLFRGGNPAASVRLLERQEQVDVLAFQEVTPAWLARLTAALGRTHPHRASRAVPGTHGLAVFSRFALGEPLYVANGPGRAVAQCLEVKVPDSPFLLCNVHLASPAAAFAHPVSLASSFRSNADLRAAQWRSLRELIRRHFAGLQDRVVLAGDFNTLASEPLYDEIRRDFVDAFREKRWRLGATFPNGVALAPRPVVRIDYVLVAPAIQPTHADVLPPSGSDHLAVRTVLRVPRGSTPPPPLHGA